MSTRPNRGRSRLVTGVIVGAAMVAVSVAAAGGGGPSASAGGSRCDTGSTLTVLHNNDGESDVLPDGDEGGVARFATLVDQAKHEAESRDSGDGGVVFVTSGDNFLASPEFSASINDGTFYDARAIELLGYDALAIGNHEFDFGPELLADFVKATHDPPFVSANLDYRGERDLRRLFTFFIGNGGNDNDSNRGFFNRYINSKRLFRTVIARTGGEKVGIIGATTEALASISSPRDVVVKLVQPAVQREINRLERRGVDQIILISHLQDVEGDVALAAQLSGIDILISGGGGELLANPDDALQPSDGPGDIDDTYPVIAVNADGAEVPVVTTSGEYKYLGQLVVDFDCDGNIVEVDADASGPRRVVSTAFPDGVTADPQLQAEVEAPVAAYVAGLATNVIADTEVELDGRRSPGVRTMETNEGNLIADSQLWQAQQLAADFGVSAPDVAIQNGGGIRNNSIIAPGSDPGSVGQVTELDTFDMVPFSNLLAIVPDIPREQFKEILENSVSRTQPGDTPGGTGRFAQVAGFTMEWTGSGSAQVVDDDGNVLTPGTRIRSVVLDDGTVIVDKGAVVPGPDIGIAIVDFLARGGDQYPFRGAPFTPVGASYQQALLNYIVAPTSAGGLGGFISEADYPEGGEGRNVELP